MNEGEKYITPENPGSEESIKIKKLVQAIILKRYFNTENLDADKVLDWLNKNSKKFNDLLKELEHEDTHLYQHTLQTPEATADIIWQRMFGSEIDKAAEVIEEEMDQAA